MSDQAKHQYEGFLQQLPYDWERVEIRQLGAVVSGGTPSREVSSYWQGSIPWVTPGEVSGAVSQLLHDTQEHISPAGLSGSGANLLPAGSLMVTTRATLGARVMNAVPMATNQGFKSIVFKSPEEGGYYFHLFKKVKPELIRRASGTTFLEISGTEFGSIQVPNPPAPEKKLIAQILDTLDTAIHETEALIVKLKAVKKGLLHDLLTRGIDANGQLRPPQSEASQLYKKSPLGWIPREWEVDFGKNVCREIVVGIVIKPTQYYRESGVAVLRSANVRETGLTLDNLVFMSPKDHRNLSKSAVGKGDVLTVRTGYPGTSCVVDDQIEEANCVDIIISRPLPDLDPSYWSTWINSDFGKKQVLAVQGGLAQQHFNVGDLMKLMVKMPPITEQEAISDQLRGVLSRIDSESKEQSKLFALKAALMDDLLTGRVRVTPLLESVQQTAVPTGA